MKRLSLFFLFLFVSGIQYEANPIALPYARISELYFNQNNDWTLEIYFAYGDKYLKKDFDSICVTTSSGTARIKLDNIKYAMLCMGYRVTNVPATTAFYNKNAIEYLDEYEYIRIQRNDKHSLRLFYVQDYYSSIKRRKL